MLTAGLVTLVVAIGILPALGSSASRSGSGSQSASGGSTVAGGLDQARSSALAMAGDPSAAQVIAAKPGTAPSKGAVTALRHAFTAAGPAAVRLILSDASGRPHLVWTGAGVGAVPAGQPAQPLPAVGTATVSAPFVAPDGDHQLTVATGVSGTVAGHPVSGAVLLTISLDALSAAAPPPAPSIAPPNGLPAAPFWAVVLVVLLLAGAWAVRRVLRPAREMVESRADLEQRYQEAVANAYLDGLTGLGNQRAFSEAFEHGLQAAARDRLPLALLLIDLDDFKRVNDTDGHSAGDALLRRFARIVEGTVRRTDRTYRLGGDEFGVLMPATDAEGAAVVARRLLAAALEPPRERDPGRSATAPKGVSFSAGITSAPRFGTAQVELYRQADAALYWSKRHGRTDVTIFDSARHDLGAALASVDDATAVQTVLDERLLRAVFQPIVALATGRIIGYEGLIRPTRSAFPDPGAMFMAAEACGRTLELDRACLETVAAAAAANPGRQVGQPEPLAAHAGGPRVQRPGPVPPAGPPVPALAAHRARADGARGHRRTSSGSATTWRGCARSACGWRPTTSVAMPACACSASSRSTWSRWTSPCRCRGHAPDLGARAGDAPGDLCATRRDGHCRGPRDGPAAAGRARRRHRGGAGLPAGAAGGRRSTTTPSTWMPSPSAITWSAALRRIGPGTGARPPLTAGRPSAVADSGQVVQPRAIPVPCPAVLPRPTQLIEGAHEPYACRRSCPNPVRLRRQLVDQAIDAARKADGGAPRRSTGASWSSAPTAPRRTAWRSRCGSSASWPRPACTTSGPGRSHQPHRRAQHRPPSGPPQRGRRSHHAGQGGQQGAGLDLRRGDRQDGLRRPLRPGPARAAGAGQPGRRLVELVPRAAEMRATSNGVGSSTGAVERSVAARLLKLMADGNQYAAGVTSLGDRDVRMIIREIYQDPATTARSRSPPRPRPPTCGRIPRAP